MKLYKPELLLEVFQILNLEKIDYVLIRNTNNEIPFNLNHTKDIDILVNFSSRDMLLKILKEYGFKKKLHPERFFIKLYGVNDFEKFKSKGGVLLDINYQFCVQSLQENMFVPLDKVIQDNIWHHKSNITFDTVSVPFMGPNEYFITYFSRLLFKNKKFDNWSKSELSNVFNNCNHKLMMQYFRLVFFNFSNTLFSLIKNNQFDEIYAKYISFKEY